MKNREKGSIEFITLALLAALIVVLAIPVLSGTAKPPVSAMSKDLHSLPHQPVTVIVTPAVTP